MNYELTTVNSSGKYIYKKFLNLQKKGAIDEMVSSVHEMYLYTHEMKKGVERKRGISMKKCCFFQKVRPCMRNKLIILLIPFSQVDDAKT